MFTTQDELEAAFYTAYPQHKRFDVTEASAIDWTDWYDAMCRANRVALQLMGAVNHEPESITHGFLRKEPHMTTDETTTSDQIESIVPDSPADGRGIQRDPAESNDQWAVRLFDWMAEREMLAPELQEIDIADLNIFINGKFVGPVATLTFINSTTGSVTLVDGQVRTGTLKLYAPPQPLPPAQAIASLSTAFSADPEYAWSWHCNLACAGMDAGLDHPSANVMAGNFMKLAFGADVTTYTPGTKSVEETCEGYVPCVDETAQRGPAA